MKQSGRPLVSVIMPTYNQEAFVTAALDSVLGQDYRNIHVIARDDGSSDRTPAILAERARSDDRLRVLDGGVNLGITGNCNRLLAACEGQYMAYFAGDDIFLPGKITAQVAWLESDPDRVLCYHDVEVFDSATDRTLYMYSARSPLRAGSFRDLVALPAIASAVSMMVRRSCIPATGFDTRVPRSSDFLLVLQALLSRGVDHPGAGFVPGVYARYRRHAGNVTNTVDAYGVEEMIAVMDILLASAPTAAAEIRMARSERLATYGFRSLLRGRHAEALKLMRMAAATSLRGFTRSLPNAARYYFKGVRAPRREDHQSNGGRS